MFTVFHSTADSEIEDLINFGIRVLAGVVPESDPQASPGACYLEQRGGRVRAAELRGGSVSLHRSLGRGTCEGFEPIS